jgi:hypothetical protein
MPTTTNEIVSIARAMADCATKAKQLRVIVQQTLDRNVVEAFDWAGANQVEADAALQAAGIDYTAVEIANAIGSLDQYRNFWDNAAVTQGDHGGNLEKLCAPIV